jgi:hypothetical protein
LPCAGSNFCGELLPAQTCPQEVNYESL